MRIHKTGAWSTHTAERCVHFSPFLSLAHQPWLQWVFEGHLLGTNGLHSLEMNWGVTAGI